MGVEAGVIKQVKVGKRERFNQRAVLAMADAMSSVAARSFGVSTSVMRPTSPYLNAPPLAHSTTSPMPCFLVVATRRAAVRNSLRSWLNPEPAADPFPLLLPGVGVAPSAGGLVDPFLPVGEVLFTGDEVVVIGFDDAAPSAVGLPDPFPPAGAVLFSRGGGFVVGSGAVAAGIVSAGEPAAAPSAATGPFADAW